MKYLLILMIMLSPITMADDIKVNLNLGGLSAHLFNNHKDFNSNHNGVGFTASKGVYSLAYSDFVNSYYDRTTMLAFGRIINGFTFAIGVFDGYQYSDNSNFGDYLFVPVISYQDAEVTDIMRFSFMANAVVVDASIPIVY